MAEECLISGVVDEPNKEPEWMDIAREIIDDFIELHPSDRSLLRDTVFFDDDPLTRMRFALYISASVIPAGEYEDIPFANGVALGKISLKQ
jgi:hypothetical protein